MNKNDFWICVCRSKRFKPQTDAGLPRFPAINRPREAGVCLDWGSRWIR